MPNDDNNDGRGRQGGRGRSDGGRGRGGRGGGGRGRGLGRGRGDSSYGRGNAGRVSQDDRKAFRRQRQLEAMSKKAQEEDDYFRQCQKEAQGKNQFNPKDSTNKARETELFGKQIVKGINFDKYDDIHVEVKVPPSTEGTSLATILPMDNFSTLEHLTPQLKTNIQLMKYSHPTPIQKNAIPYAMAGQDLMCCAQTGSGKTCSFLLPVIASLVGQQGKENKPANNSKNGKSNNNKFKLEPATPKCVVLAPTRELAMQIELEAEKLTHGIPSIQPVVVYGGANPKAQLKALAYASANHNDLLVVATPGRLTDFVDRNLISLSNVEYLILDEADRCLDMGFEPQIRKLVQQSGMTPKEKRQTFLFSATFPAAIQTLASEFLRPYVWVAIGRVGSTTDSITQVLIKATPDKRHKLELVVDALENGPDGRTLIFVQKKRTATWLKKQLNKGGPDAGPKQEKGSGGSHPPRNNKGGHQPFKGKEIRFSPVKAEEIHGDRSQSQREAALEKFRSGKCTVLVATDVAARGLDIPGVEHVINMDLPNAQDDFDSYVHRIGRTGRAGHQGIATSLFVTGDDPKVGNGRIASLMLAQLKEANQEVPSWLEGLVAGGGGGNGNNINNSKSSKPQFGGTDVRKNTSRPANTNKGSNNEDRGRGRNNTRGGRGRNNTRGGRGRGPSSEHTNGNGDEKRTDPNSSGRGGRGCTRDRGRGRGGGRGRGEDGSGRPRGRVGRGTAGTQEANA